MLYEEYRMCLNCGRVRPASIPKHVPEPECLDPETGLSGCTWDATPTEAWQYWRKKAYEERERAKKAEAELAAIKAGDKVVVPKEPTQEMVLAALATVAVEKGGRSYYPYRFYKAMIEAAKKETGE